MEQKDKKKLLGQIFTPINLVEIMLNEAGFSGTNTLIFKTMEPAFGKGVFLIEMIKRIIREGKRLHYSKKQIEEVIENNIYGIEIDSELFNFTLLEIKNLLKDNNLNTNLEFKLYNEDTIRVWEQFKNKFDIVIGNPPYVRTKNLDLDTRLLLKGFSFSTGLKDLYLSFIELSFKLLNSNGKMVLVTPTTWFQTKSAEKFRNFLQISKSLKTLILLDADTRPFKESVDTCIFTIYKNLKTTTTIYELSGEHLSFKGNIELEELKFNNTFIFRANKQILGIMKEGFKKERFKVSHGIGTLQDSFFIRKEKIGENLFIKTLKGSTGKYFWLFFPYDNEGKLLELETIKEKNPQMFQLLLENKEDLTNRSLDFRQKWWGFGRSQGIANIFKEKYSINYIFLDQKTIKLTFLEKNIALNAGYYILTDVNFAKLKKLIYSNTFIEYAKTFGSWKNGGFYTLSTKQVELFLNTFYEIVYN